MGIHGLLLTTATLSTCARFAWQAVAKDTTADEGGGLRDIVVTARKASESLQTTPVAVTALDSQALTEQQISEVLDLQRATPGLSIAGAGTGPSSIVYMAIRGNAQNRPKSASDAALVIYRSEEPPSEPQSLMSISYGVFCLRTQNTST